MEEENGSGYNDNSDVGCLFWIKYFLTIRPQKKKEEELKQMMETLEVGTAC